MKNKKNLFLVISLVVISVFTIFLIKIKDNDETNYDVIFVESFSEIK